MSDNTPMSKADAALDPQALAELNAQRAQREAERLARAASQPTAPSMPG